MGCCGKGRKSSSNQSVPRILLRPSPPVVKGLRQPVGTTEVGCKCRYCGTVVTEKMKNTIRGWVRVGWCSKCRLEV